MPLILAVEPDRRQAANLAAVLRVRPRTELVMANAAAPALKALGNRVPDVLLTSPLLSPQDDAALAEWMESLGAAADRVQALTIPILAADQAEPAPVRGIFARLRRRRAPVAPGGCEPSAFAEQVGVYLERVEPEEPPPPMWLAPLAPGFAARLRALGVLSAPALMVPALRVSAARISAQLHDWRLSRLAAALDVPGDSATVEEPWVELPLEALAEPPATAPQASPQPEAFLEPGDDVWVLRVVPGVDSVQTIRIPRPAARKPAAPKPARQKQAPRKRPAPARAPQPVQDEWGFFDPSQCGFSALIAKLDEIAEHEDPRAHAETNVRVISY
jgi:hypothetical protein